MGVSAPFPEAAAEETPVPVLQAELCDVLAELQIHRAAEQNARNEVTVAREAGRAAWKRADHLKNELELRVADIMGSVF